MKKVLVIGDVCEDVYIYGKSSRLAPEAPVPVFVPCHEKRNGGMAKNVYNNLVSLGINCDIIHNVKEIQKIRYVDEKTNHIFIRVDTNESDIDRVKDYLIDKEFLSQYDAVVISDYNKGFLSEEDIEYHETCNNIMELEHIFDDKLVVTLSENGCRYKKKTYPVEKVEIKDLSGAGDTFLAAFVAEYMSSQNVEKSIIFANECATQVVQLKGVNIVKKRT